MSSPEIKDTHIILHVVYGPQGCGKTTAKELLTSLFGVEHCIDEENLSYEAIKNRVQEPHLYKAKKPSSVEVLVITNSEDYLRYLNKIGDVNFYKFLPLVKYIADMVELTRSTTYSDPYNLVP